MVQELREWGRSIIPTILPSVTLVSLFPPPYITYSLVTGYWQLHYWAVLSTGRSLASLAHPVRLYHPFCNDGFLPCFPSLMMPSHMVPSYKFDPSVISEAKYIFLHIKSFILSYDVADVLTNCCLVCVSLYWCKKPIYTGNYVLLWIISSCTTGKYGHSFWFHGKVNRFS
jgi:hypothetical protein